MARHKDIGPYSCTNVRICKAEDNHADKKGISAGKRNNKYKPFIANGCTYDTLPEAADALNLKQQAIWWRLQSTTFTNYYYI